MAEGGGEEAEAEAEAEERLRAEAGLELRAPVREEQFAAVIAHLRHNFFADEPLNRAVALCAPGQPHAELEAHALATLRDGLSCVALHGATGQVAGVALNGVTRPGDVARARAALDALADTKFRRIFSLLYGANLQLDLFGAHGVDRVFECRILSVDRRWRGKGLACALLRRSEAIARQHGFKVLKEDATGLFSQRVAERCGLRAVAQVRYVDAAARDEASGHAPILPPRPHDCLKVMVKILH
ncbi:hypothetical protein R5R35_012444 [Gryllus longicercus]|uniref:aralkylamine N-acetyltransferase n=1 Tax=Gryllus longicercus TaxID=2509291 RepID=A0AAN9VTK2_9ORTH